jgi:hypothetical protein
LPYQPLGIVSEITKLPCSIEDWAKILLTSEKQYLVYTLLKKLTNMARMYPLSPMFAELA